MWPILALSVLTVSCALERAFFWVQLLSQEGRIAHDVMEAAHHDLHKAARIAHESKDLAIGRFLLAPLKLRQATPETFRLALETAADKEFMQMRRGDKLLETVVAISPLLGLLGTVTGLIKTFGSLNIGGGAGTAEATQAAGAIGEALITTAGGMIVAIMALLFFRVFVTLQADQIDYFTDLGNELELVYRQVWYESDRLRSLLPAETISYSFPTAAPPSETSPESLESYAP